MLDVFDDIYLKYGRLGLKHLSPAARDVIESKVSDGDFESYVTQTAAELASKVTNGDFQTYVTQTAAEILLKANKADPAGGLLTAYIQILGDLVKILSGGRVEIVAGAAFNLRAGSGTNAIGLSNDEANGYMQWAGNADPAAAPFSVKRDGTVKATTLELGNSQITDVTNTYAQHFYENADTSYPATFSIYIPENTGSVASLKLTFKAQKYRAYSKGNVVSSTAAQTNNTTVESLGTPHNHTQPSHGHSSSITYGIYEKATLPTSCTLTVDGTVVNTYTNTPPSVSELEISSYLSKTNGIIDKGWHEIQISTNDDAMIVANVFVQTVVNSVTGTM